MNKTISLIVSFILFSILILLSTNKNLQKYVLFEVYYPGFSSFTSTDVREFYSPKGHNFYESKKVKKLFPKSKVLSVNSANRFNESLYLIEKKNSEKFDQIDKKYITDFFLKDLHYTGILTTLERTILKKEKFIAHSKKMYRDNHYKVKKYSHAQSILVKELQIVEHSFNISKLATYFSGKCEFLDLKKNKQLNCDNFLNDYQNFSLTIY